VNTRPEKVLKQAVFAKPGPVLPGPAFPFCGVQPGAISGIIWWRGVEKGSKETGVAAEFFPSEISAAMPWHGSRAGRERSGGPGAGPAVRDNAPGMGQPMSSGIPVGLPMVIRGAGKGLCRAIRARGDTHSRGNPAPFSPPFSRAWFRWTGYCGWPEHPAGISPETGSIPENRGSPVG